MAVNLERLHEYPIICPDTETTGLEWERGDRMFGIAIAVWDGQRIHSQYWDIREKPQIVRALQREIPMATGRIVNHNMKFDAHMLRLAGVKVPLQRLECTSVRAALIDEHEPSFSLDALGRKYVGQGKHTDIYAELAEMFGGKPTKDAQMPNLQRAPERIAAKYATPDPEIAIKLWLWQEKEIERQELQQVWDLERRLMPVLIEIEEDGIRVDEELARTQLIVIQKKIITAQQSLNKIAGKEVNANSAPQMRELFKVGKVEHETHVEWFTDTGFKLEVTDGGEASIGKKSLQVMAELGDKRAEAVIALRKYIKATQFLKDHILGHAIKGRVYPNYNQTRGDNELGTGTGRLSIDDPAMQQIPARDRDIAALVRPCFVPELDHAWGCADWEQFEFRWFAHYTKDETILKAYADDPDTDYHQIVSTITGIPRNAPRAGAANAKQINLGLVFGMGEGEMAYQMGLDYTSRRDSRGREWKNAGPKAKAVFQTYHGAIPGVRALLDQASSIARARGFVKTAMGRHIRFPGGVATHKAAGLVFQGTSADCMKVKMIELHNMGKQYGFKYKLSVHDEHNTSIPRGIVKKVQPMIVDCLQAFNEGDAVQCRVPIRSSMKVGANWHEGSKKD